MRRGENLPAADRRGLIGPALKASRRPGSDATIWHTFDPTRLPAPIGFAMRRERGLRLPFALPLGIISVVSASFSS